MATFTQDDIDKALKSRGVVAGQTAVPQAPDISSADSSVGIPNMFAGVPQITKPTTAQSHAAGIAEYNRGIPQVTAMPGTPEFYQQKMSGIEYQKAHPFGSDISPHPGLGGKLLHGLSQIGNIAGDVLAPGVTELIPNSNLNRAVNEKGLADEFQKAQQGETQKESVEQRPEIAELQGENKANLEHEKEDAAKEKQESDQDFKAQAAQEHEQFLLNLANKKGPTTPFEQWAANPQVYDAYLKDQAANKQSGKGSMMSPYAAVKLMDYAYLYDPRLLPFAQQTMQALAKQLGMPLPQGLDISTPPAGQPRTDTGVPEGLHQPGAPTEPTRTAGQFADKALLAIPRVRDEVGSLSKNLGPISGREAHFLVGDIGSSGNPEFDKQYSKLRTDITFLTSNAARFHLNSVRAVEEFLKLADTGKASAQNLEGFIDAMEGWAKDAKKVGEGNQPAGGNAPPAGANVISLDDFLNPKTK